MKVKAQVTAAGSYEGGAPSVYLCIEDEEFEFRCDTPEDARAWGARLYEEVVLVPESAAIAQEKCEHCGSPCTERLRLADYGFACIGCVGEALERAQTQLVGAVAGERSADQEVERLQAQIDAAREAVGKAWLRPGSTLAEAIALKMKSLEAAGQPGLEDLVGAVQLMSLEAIAREGGCSVRDVLELAIADYIEAQPPTSLAAPEPEDRKALVGACVKRFGLKDAAARLGVSTGAVRNWANGHKAVTDERADQIRALLAEPDTAAAA